MLYASLKSGAEGNHRNDRLHEHCAGTRKNREKIIKDNYEAPGEVSGKPK